MADHPGTHGETVLGRVRELPGGAELLELAAGRDDVELVGGAVRDLLLGRTPRELDVVVSDDAPAFARALALSLGLPREPPPGGRSGTIVHERFGTALLWWPQGRVDVACRRAESYSEPGALPDVRPGTAEEDLRRRDFTVNAIAVSLGGRRKGTMRTRAPRARGSRSRASARASRARASWTTPHACCGSRATSRAWGSSPRSTPPSSPPRRSLAAPCRRSPARASARSCGSR